MNLTVEANELILKNILKSVNAACSTKMERKLDPVIGEKCNGE